MLNIIDASPDIYMAYSEGSFDLRKWNEYIDRIVPAIKELCLNDMKESISPEYSWESYYLPVLNGVAGKMDEIEKTVHNFHLIVDGLEEQIIRRFGKCVEADIVLYLGLCNGAGWVTKVCSRTTVMLGIEKITELQWGDIDSMNGLILHEMGHVYQAEFGELYRDCHNLSDRFMWQLFTEGIAMVFEQEILNDRGYFHQDKNGWKDWCSQNIRQIALDFETDSHTMTAENQRYFGDWVRYESHSDVGYYLGTCFVRFILEKEMFDNIICFDIEDVKHYFNKFISTL